jgi:hypothetical protein
MPMDPDIARLTRVRRRWAWIVACCLAGTIAAFAVTLTQFPDQDSLGSGTGISIGVLLVMVTFVSGVLCLGYGTALSNRRADPGGAAASAPAVPSRGRREMPRWLLWICVLAWVGLGVGMLPVPVDGVAYLAGAGQQATFTPVSYGQACGKACYTVTKGFLTAGGDRTPATWPDQVPLGRPVQTRLAVWDWGFASKLFGGPGEAVRDVFGGGLWVLFGGFLLYLAAVRAWRRLQAGRPSMTWIRALSPGRAGREQPHVSGALYRRGTVLGLKLGVDVADVGVDGIHRDR